MSNPPAGQHPPSISLSSTPPSSPSPASISLPATPSVTPPPSSSTCSPLAVASSSPPSTSAPSTPIPSSAPSTPPSVSAQGAASATVMSTSTVGLLPSFPPLAHPAPVSSPAAVMSGYTIWPIFLLLVLLTVAAWVPVWALFVGIYRALILGLPGDDIRVSLATFVVPAAMINLLAVNVGSVHFLRGGIPDRSLIELMVDLYRSFWEGSNHRILHAGVPIECTGVAQLPSLIS